MYWNGSGIIANDQKVFLRYLRTRRLTWYRIRHWFYLFQPNLYFWKWFHWPFWINMFIDWISSVEYYFRVQFHYIDGSVWNSFANRFLYWQWEFVAIQQTWQDGEENDSAICAEFFFARLRLARLYSNYGRPWCLQTRIWYI